MSVRFRYIEFTISQIPQFVFINKYGHHKKNYYQNANKYPLFKQFQFQILF